MDEETFDPRVADFVEQCPVVTVTPTFVKLGQESLEELHTCLPLHGEECKGEVV